jgi:Winged helix DNA-binding domain
VAERVLTRQELNRALLARQLLLDRTKLPVPRAVERLGGLQAQHTSSPYLQLCARLAGFEREQLTHALERRRVVKALLMRGTLHLVTPADYWALATVRRELGGGLWPPSYEKLVPKARLAGLAKEALGELRGTNRTLKEMLTLLQPHARPPATPAFLWRRLQSYANVVHVPPSGTWGYHREGVYAPAAEWIPAKSPQPSEAFEHLVSRYLAAFGPATKHDIGQWAGIPRLTPISEALGRLDLRTFRDERGQTLYDLRRAPLPDPETEAPVRLVPRFDNLVLSHADRTRILGDVRPTRIVTKNAIVHATILVDGFVCGTWQLEKGRVKLEPFGRLARPVRAAVEEEAARVEEFVAD